VTRNNDLTCCKKHFRSSPRPICRFESTTKARLLPFRVKLCEFQTGAPSVMSSVKLPAKLFFALACVFVVRFCVSQTSPVKGATTGITVQGRVLLDPQQLPVKKASIQLLGRRGQEGPYSAVTDADGRFVIDGVTAGRYLIQVEHPGLVAGSRRSVNIISQGTSEVLLHMQPAAIITGTITDADGDPVRDVNVMATRVGGSRRWRGHDSGNGSTNDLGEFRIPDLRPGRYTVLATPRRDLPVFDATSPAGKGQLVYVPTYYPGTADQTQSVPVDAEAGHETPVNLVVLTSRAFRVTGDVLGLPSSDMAQIMLHSDHKVDADQQLQPGGKFEFANLLPGSYRVGIIIVSLGNGQPPRMRSLAVDRNIEVTDEDIRDIHLQVDQGASVRGRFRLETGQQFDWTQLTVMLASSDENSGLLLPSNGTEPPTFSSVAKDGSFEMKTIPSGRYHLVVGARGSSDKLRDYFTKSVMLNGQEVGDSGFEINSATDLEIVISAKGATIEGIVVDDRGNPVSSAIVVDVPDSDRRLRLDLYQQDTTDERGHFSLRGLNPGSYTVLAFEDLEDSPQDPEFLTSYGSKGEKVAADEGTDKRIVLKLIPASSD
jgi:Carboxypeptidase regulatory-like domain